MSTAEVPSYPWRPVAPGSVILTPDDVAALRLTLTKAEGDSWAAESDGASPERCDEQRTRIARIRALLAETT